MEKELRLHGDVRGCLNKNQRECVSVSVSPSERLRLVSASTWLCPHQINVFDKSVLTVGVAGLHGEAYVQFWRCGSNRCD